MVTGMNFLAGVDQLGEVHRTQARTEIIRRLPTRRCANGPAQVRCADDVPSLAEFFASATQSQRAEWSRRRNM